MRFWSIPGLIPTLIALAAAFGTFSLLLPVVPLAVLSTGASEVVAGAATGVFMGTTVLTQMVTPSLLRRFGYNPVMMAAALTLGLPSLVHVLSLDPVVVLLVSALRGIGFGALAVAESALIAELVPLRLLGKATGLAGMVIGAAQMVFLPVGLWIVDTRFGFSGVFVLAAVVALAAGVMCLGIPRIKAASVREIREPMPRAATWKLTLVPALALNSLSMSFGAISSFLPAAVLELEASGTVVAGFMLSITGGAAMIFRFVAGLIADRRGGPGATMIPGQVLGAVGMAIMAAALLADGEVWWLVVATIAFGAGFGIVQNEALLAMFTRLPHEKVSEASAIWNISYDSGTGLGSFILGAVAAQAAYGGAYAVGGCIIVAFIGMTVADAVVGRHRIVELGNTQASLRRLVRRR